MHFYKLTGVGLSIIILCSYIIHCIITVLLQCIVYNSLHFIWGPVTDPKSREVVLNACKAVGSISNTSFDIRFNPDIFSPGMKNKSLFRIFDRYEQLWPSLFLFFLFFRSAFPRWDCWRHPEAEATSQRCSSLPGVVSNPIFGEWNLFIYLFFFHSCQNVQCFLNFLDLFCDLDQDKEPTYDECKLFVFSNCFFSYR